MPMLDLSALGGASPFGGLLNLPTSQGFPTADPATDEAAAAQQAREAAAEVLSRKMKGSREGPFRLPDENAPAVQYALGDMPPNVQPGAYGSLAPQLPQPAAPAPMSAAAPPAAAPVPMPQPRPAASPSTVDDTTIPANASPTQGQQAAADTSAVPETSMLGRIKKFGSENSNMLMGMAAGFAGAPSLGTGMSRGFSGAAAGGQLDQKQQLFQQQQIGARATYEALVAAGVPRQQALAGAFNPEMQKSLVQSYITDRGKKVQLIKDASGREIPYEVNQYPKDGEPVLKPINVTGVPGGPQTNGEPNYDPVTQRDESYLKTLSPEDASAVKAIVNGDILPTGRNLQRLMPLVTRYENGFTDRDYKARNKFTTEWGSNTPSSVGGQKGLMGTSLGHLADAAESLANLENVNGLGSADVAHVTNAAKNRTTHNAALANKANDEVAKFSGEVGKLYSGSSGGGVHEREETRGRLGPNMSSEELIAGLEANRDLIRSKQQALEQHAADVFGPEGAKKYDFLGENGRAALAKIDKSIAKLRGDQSATQEPGAAAQNAPAPVSTKEQYDALPAGKTYIAPDGSVRTKK